MEQPSDWIQLVYKLPTFPSRNRVYVWRKFKKAGAVYYTQGVAILPNTDLLLKFMQKMQKAITSYGGHAILMNVSFANVEDKIKTIELFNLNVKSEYQEIEQPLLKILHDIESIRQKDLLSDTYLENRLATVIKLRKTFDCIKARDYFKVSISENISNLINLSIKTIKHYRLEINNINCGLF